MRVEKGKAEPVFDPITIVIESKDELDALASLLNYYPVIKAMDKVTDSNMGHVIYNGLVNNGGNITRYFTKIKEIIIEA